jgi:hypothetical protein
LDYVTDDLTMTLASPADAGCSRSALAVRMYAALVHLTISALVAGLCALLVFGLWYPAPFRQISGGRDLFLLVVAVDVVLGPVITFCVFDRRKPAGELRRDLSIVAALQLAGLAYGLHTVYLARPVVLALETDRLRVVRVIDLPQNELAAALPEWQQLPWFGVAMVATRPPAAGERQDAIAQGLAGRDVGMRPQFWRPAAQAGAAFASAALPLDRLASRAGASEVLPAAVKDAGLAPDRLGYLPLLGRTTGWSALISRSTGAIVGYVPVDGF